jgi:hypothetical protein
MGGEPFSAGLLSAARFIIGPWQALTRSDVEPAVEASPATKFVVPANGSDWLWAGVKSRSEDAYASQISRGVKQAIDGDPISFERDFDVATIAGMVVGGVLFLCVAGNLLGVVVGML